ncbi:GTP 3',8-cyclase MoaA [Wenzhouxiangella limi]|uniref:GTP 3',8-cyclase n=1 Tax=Wenzhouxiangella limi TaxID=2707351 RepID=A0A845URU3_9GAMM|nr:GTP 3',8-cyclase MoaA [Wenzhouxiangella limi]NDY94287.1 GTP 3',8-cyclase MoaA [Wenzhouxiangella limi]
MTEQDQNVLKLRVLTDTRRRPLRDLRISVMDRCNFRCPYCMPEDKYDRHFQFLHKSERLSFAEIVRLSRLFVERGVTKLRLTGGEPLLRRDLVDLVGELSLIDGVEDLALTTNGIMLPQHAAALKAAGLDRVTVSFDSLDPDIFRMLSGGRGSPEQVLDGIDAAVEAGLTPVKINTVIQRGVNDETVHNLLERFRGTGVVVRFIEFMDVGTLNDWDENQLVPSAELLERIEQRWPMEPLDANYRGEVAQRYRYADGQGEIGFISSVTQPFCGDCTRARLSSEGSLYTCLFANKGTDLRGPLREGVDDATLGQIIDGIWRKRSDRYSEMRTQLSGEREKIEMYYIGG